MKQLNFLFLLFCLTTFATAVVAQEANKDVAAPTSISQDQNPVRNPQLREELLKRAKADQDMQKEMASKYPAGRILLGDDKEEYKTDAEKNKAVDKENTEWLKKTVELYGYPGFSSVGKDGTNAAFALFMRADQDSTFQKKVLELMKKAVEQKDINPIYLAALTDRVLIAEGKPQRYGTRMSMTDGVFKPSPIEDEANVDKRRAELGLPTMADYMKSIQSKIPKTNE